MVENEKESGRLKLIDKRNKGRRRRNRGREEERDLGKEREREKMSRNVFRD